MTALAFVLAAGVGVVLGVLGGGGSILMVPILVYVMGYDPKQAIAMSLPMVGLMALTGGMRHWRAGNVALRVAVPFGACAMLGAFGGAYLARGVSSTAQLLMLAAVMIATATVLLEPRLQPPPEGDVVPRHPVLMLPIGIAAGVVTGLVGISGGVIITPTLNILGRVPLRRAVGTSLMVIAMSAASGTIGYLGHQEVPWAFFVPFTAVAVAGVLAGSVLSRHISDLALRRGFAIFLLALGALIFWSKRGVG